MGISIVPTMPLCIEEGTHAGKIVRVERRTEPYDYVDIIIADVDGKVAELKWGAPFSTSMAGKLMKFVMNFVKVEEGKELNLDCLINQSVTFVSFNEETKRGTFARIVDGSIKPAKARK